MARAQADSILASIVLTRQLQASSIRTIIDDPQEVRMQNLSWYVTESHQAFAAIGHLISQEQSGWKLHNAKVSFVSGIAYALGKRILMLAHEPYESPIDYRELLVRHSTSKTCEDAAKHWIEQVEQDYRDRVTAPEQLREDARARTALSQIQMGDFVAEQEADELSDYFVHTPAYDEAFNSRYTIFLGRKGSGKTAILYKLKSDVSIDTRNHVCVIKPVAYELAGVQRIELGTLTKSVVVSAGESKVVTYDDAHLPEGDYEVVIDGLSLLFFCT